MTISAGQVFEFALSLPPATRADLAFHLLQSLNPPGEEIAADEFGAELRERVDGSRRGALPSFSREETRAIVQERLSRDRAP